MQNKSLGLYNLIDATGINQSIQNVLASNIDFNTYTSPKGLKELRIEITKFLNEYWHYNVSYKDMLITTGSQQSINLVAYSLLKENDTILIEQPTYFGAINVFKNRNVNLIGIDLTENGFDLRRLENKIIKYKPKLIYVTPTFNNPTGFSWSNSYRKKFLKIINKYNILVLEDDPYSLINYTKTKYKSLYEINKGKNIIYLSTFSKYISPSIKVGYILSESTILNKIYKFKENFDLCTSLFNQLVILDYLNNNDLNEVILKKVSVYKVLLKKTIKDLKKNKFLLKYSNVKGGLYIYVKFNNKVNDNIFTNLKDYYISGKHENETRINICNKFDK